MRIGVLGIKDKDRVYRARGLIKINAVGKNEF